jgi:hypothetical protein
MSKFTYIGSFLIAVTLIFGGVYFPQSFIMSFVASSAWMVIARGIVALLMIGLVVTNPPRSKTFRIILAAASVSMLGWAIGYFTSGTIQFADSILFFHAALSFALAALESKEPVVEYPDFATIVERHRKARIYKSPHLA